jgi:4-amino-4-deoxy-L-arabinose transferase-like glycosyltransferase
LLLLLVVLAAGARAWLIVHTEVAARDSIGFIRYAWQLESQPWVEVLRQSQQHPGYPVLLLAISLPVRAYFGGTDAVAMQVSAQLASGLAGVLLVLPMFYLGKELFDRRVGFGAAALFQCLPVSARIMSDALSEATFLFFTAMALLGATFALRRQSVALFGLCGLFTGLAYLTRPEGALLLPAAGLVLLGRQAVPGCRQPWGRLVTCGATLVLTAVVVALPYVAATGQFTTKPTGLELLKTASVFPEAAPGARAAAPESAPARPLAASLPLAVWAQEMEKGSLGWSIRALATEVIKSYYYVAWVPALAGLWWFRDRLRRVSGAWVLLLLSLLHALVLLRLAVVMGYVSERHVLVLVLCGSFWTAAGVAAFGQWLWALGTRLRPISWSAEPIIVLALLALAAPALVQSLKPLHANRAGHHAAGLWLAAHTVPADPVFDPFCWAHFYAGRVFWEGRSPPIPPGHAVMQYVVLERPDREHSRLPLIPRAQELAAHGRLVYHWPEQAPAESAEVFVYAVPP